MSVFKGELKYRIEVMIAPELDPSAVTYVKLNLWEVISEHDGIIYLVLVSSECSDILFYPFQRCELIPQTEIKNPSFIGWFHCRQPGSSMV